MKHRRPHPGQHRVTRRCGLLCAAGLALLPDIALANPHLEGIRQLSLAGSGRASATGVDAALVNPSGLTATQQFAIAPVYQYSVANNAHGLGALIIDSTFNFRSALLYATVFMSSGLSVLLFTLVTIAERMIVRWHA